MLPDAEVRELYATTPPIPKLSGLPQTLGAKIGAARRSARLPLVTIRSPSTSSGAMGLPSVLSSSSVTIRLSAWVFRDFSLFNTPPPGLRSRVGGEPRSAASSLLAAVDSDRALGPLIFLDPAAAQTPDIPFNPRWRPASPWSSYGVSGG